MDLSKLKGTYTSDNFSGATGIQAIREDISQFIGNTNIEGIRQSVNEILENALDEGKEILEMLKSTNSGFQYNIFIKFSKDCEVIIKDTGRGIPIVPKDVDGTIKPCIQHAFESNSFGGKSAKGKGYKVKTSGVHGAGACCTNAGSKYFEAITTILDTEKSYKIRYEEGKIVEELHEIPTLRKADGTVDHGTIIKFRYDETMFELRDVEGKEVDYPFNIPEFVERLKNYSLSLTNINFYFSWELPNGSTGKEVIKSSDYNVENVLKKASTDGKIITFKTSYSEPEEDVLVRNTRLDYEFQLYATKSLHSSTISIVNNLKMEHSTITNLILNIIMANVENSIKSYAYYRPEVPIPLEFKRCQLAFTTNLEIENANFGAQVKNNFTNSKFIGNIDPRLKDWFYKTKEGKELIQYCIDKIASDYRYMVSNYQSNVNKQEEIEKKKLKNEASKNKAPSKKLVVPPNCDYHSTFLLVIEGDTAKNKVLEVLTQLPSNFATLEIKGRLTNALTTNFSNITNSENKKICMEILRAFNIPWKRIILLTDGDPDGGQIKDLTALIALEYEPHILTQNRFSHLHAPTYKFIIQNPNNPSERRKLFLFSEKQVKAIEEKFGTSIIYRERFKGLGQINTDDLKDLLQIDQYGNLRHEVILTPSKTLIEEKAVFNQFYGKSPKHRQQYLLDNFATPRFSQYFNTRNYRQKDVSFATDFLTETHDTIKDKHYFNTKQMFDMNESFSKESQVKIKQFEYLLPIDYLIAQQEMDEFRIDYDELVDATALPDEED